MIRFKNCQIKQSRFPLFLSSFFLNAPRSLCIGRCLKPLYRVIYSGTSRAQKASSYSTFTPSQIERSKNPPLQIERHSYLVTFKSRDLNKSNISFSLCLQFLTESTLCETILHSTNRSKFYKSSRVFASRAAKPWCFAQVHSTAALFSLRTLGENVGCVFLFFSFLHHSALKSRNASN